MQPQARGSVFPREQRAGGGEEHGPLTQQVPHDGRLPLAAMAALGSCQGPRWEAFPSKDGSRVLAKKQLQEPPGSEFKPPNFAESLVPIQ